MLSLSDMSQVGVCVCVCVCVCAHAYPSVAAKEKLLSRKNKKSELWDKRSGQELHNFDVGLTFNRTNLSLKKKSGCISFNFSYLTEKRNNFICIFFLLQHKNIIKI